MKRYRNLRLPLLLFGVILLTAALSALRLVRLPGLGPTLALEDLGPTVVQRIQALSRLETVSFHEQQVLEAEKRWGRLPRWLKGDRLLFVAQGEVVAGVDLSVLRDEDVRLEGGRVYLRLPEPKVFAVRLDSRGSRVHSRSTGWLNDADPQLESDVRRRAEELLLARAREAGILDQARDNARKAVGRLVAQLGVEDVVFL